MSNKKQSSVEWLDRWFRDNPEATYEEGNAALQQAKEMHKDEICKSYVYGAAYRIDVSNGLKPERYYNETYGDNTP